MSRRVRASSEPCLLLTVSDYHPSATSLLKQDYKETMTVKEATKLCLKVMSKTMDTTKLGSEKRTLYVCLR